MREEFLMQDLSDEQLDSVVGGKKKKKKSDHQNKKPAKTPVGVTVSGSVNPGALGFGQIGGFTQAIDAGPVQVGIGAIWTAEL